VTEQPLPHQIEAARILGARSILADKRGLGKTWSSLIWAEDSRRLLVLARKEIAENFMEEMELRYPHRNAFNIISKTPAERYATVTIMGMLNDFTAVVNLESWRRDDTIISDLRKLHFDTVIVDEAHSLKDESSTFFQGTRGIILGPNMCDRCGSSKIQFLNDAVGWFCTTCYGLGNGKSSIEKVQFLTGTPILNTPYDLWALLHLIDPVEWPTKDQFLKHYCWQGADGRYRFLRHAESRILSWLGTNYLERTREDAGVVLPPQKVQTYHLDFNKQDYPEQWDFYEQLKEAAAIKISETETLDIISMRALITRLRQAITWPAGIVIDGWRCDVKQSIKVDAAEERTQLFRDEGHRVLLFSQFVPPLHELKRRFGKNAIVLDGSTPDYLRREIRHDFDRRHKRNKWDVLLAHYRVGGESLNLNAATAEVFIDYEWSPGREDQGQGRMDRMGQTEENYVEKLHASPSIDDWHVGLLKYKQAILDNFNVAKESLREHLLS